MAPAGPAPGEVLLQLIISELTFLFLAYFLSPALSLSPSFLSSSLLPSLSLSLLSFFFSLIEGEMLVCNHLSLSCLVSRVRLSAAPWTVARQAPLSMGFSRQEYWSGLPSPPPGIFATQESNVHPLCLLP